MSMDSTEPEHDQQDASMPGDADVEGVPAHDGMYEAVNLAPEAAVVEPLGRSAASGTLWLTGQKWVTRIAGFATIAILTRLLDPEEFGVVAAASTILPLILLLSDLGLSTYLVQAEDLNDRLLSTGFWFSVCAGAVLAGALALTAPLVADAFGIPESASVLRVMSLSVLLVVLGSVPTALLKRAMKFRLLAYQVTVATFASQAVAVVLAVSGAGVWALVAQQLVTQGVGSALAWHAARWRPRFQFIRGEFATMASFGTKVVSVELVATGRATAEAAIISNVLGAAALGYLSIAQRLVGVAQDVGASALVPVSTVVFAKVRESEDRLRSGYVRALKIGYAAVAPMLTFVAVGAPLIVPILFGPQWGPSVPVAQALAVASILVLGAMIDHGLHYGVGRPGRWFGYAVCIDLLTLGTTFLVAPYGLEWVALGFVAVALLATVVRWALVGRLLHYPAGGLARIFLVAMVPVVVSGGLGLIVRNRDCRRDAAAFAVPDRTDHPCGASGGRPSGVARRGRGCACGDAHSGSHAWALEVPLLTQQEARDQPGAGGVRHSRWGRGWWCRWCGCCWPIWWCWWGRAWRGRRVPSLWGRRCCW